MTKKKYNRLMDFITVLLILFPLIMCLFTARATGTFADLDIATYVEQFSLSGDLVSLIEGSVGQFDFAIDDNFSHCAYVIMSNALLIWVFRLFLSAMTFIPKMGLKFINMFTGGDDH